MQKQRLQLMVDWNHYQTLLEIMRDNKLRNESQALYKLMEDYNNSVAREFKLVTEYKKLEDRLRNLEYELRQKVKQQEVKDD